MENWIIEMQEARKEKSGSVLMAEIARISLRHKICMSKDISMTESICRAFGWEVNTRIDNKKIDDDIEKLFKRRRDVVEIRCKSASYYAYKPKVFESFLERISRREIKWKWDNPKSIKKSA